MNQIWQSGLTASCTESSHSGRRQATYGGTVPPSSSSEDTLQKHSRPPQVFVHQHRKAAGTKQPDEHPKADALPSEPAFLSEISPTAAVSSMTGSSPAESRKALKARQAQTRGHCSKQTGANTQAIVVGAVQVRLHLLHQVPHVPWSCNVCSSIASI